MFKKELAVLLRGKEIIMNTDTEILTYLAYMDAEYDLKYIYIVFSSKCVRSSKLVYNNREEAYKAAQKFLRRIS